MSDQPTVQPTGIEHSETLTDLAVALAKAQAQFTHPAKSRTVDVGQYSYSYAELPVVLDAVRPALTAHGLSILQPVEVRGSKVKVWTMLLHSSGQWIRAALVLDAGGEKAQQVGSAISYGRRYGLSAMLGIAADEDEDGALASSAPAPKPVTGPGTPKPATGPKPVPVTRGLSETAETFEVLKVQSKEQEKKDKSGTFIIYRIAFDDQRIAETFDKKLADQAEAAIELGVRVRRTLEANPNPKFLPKLIGLELIEPDETLAPDAGPPPDDDLPF